MVTTIVIFLMVVSLGSGQDDPEAVEFFEQYPPNATRLRNAYEEIRMKATLTWPKPKPGPDIVKDLEYARSGSRFKIVRRVVEMGGGWEGYVEVIVRNTFTFAGLTKEAGSSEYQLHDGIHFNGQEDVFAGILSTGSPFAIHKYIVADFINEPGFEVIDAREVWVGNERQMIIDWKHPTKSKFMDSGSFTFLPDRCWALQETSISFRTTKNFYGEDRDGIPVIQRTEHWVGATPKRLEFYEDVHELNFGKVPNSEFSLEQYGISSTDRVSRLIGLPPLLQAIVQKASAMTVSIIACAGIISIALVVRYRRRKRRSP